MSGPRVLELEHGDVYPTAMVEQMKAFGLFGATIAPRYGGLGMPTSTYARIVTLISEVWIALPGAFNTHLIMAALVERFGTAAQKREFLPRFATGELRGGLALTEADGGTDLQAIRTRAVRDGDHYVINGAKTWITNGIEGSCFALLVKTDPGPSRATAACRCSSRKRVRAFGSGANWTSSATTAAIPPSCSSRTTACRPTA